jgi:hypothetical protein
MMDQLAADLRVAGSSAKAGDRTQRRWRNSAKPWPNPESRPIRPDPGGDAGVSGENFFRYARRWSERHRDEFAAQALDAEKERFFTEAAQQSLQKQAEIEAADAISFEEFLRRYFTQQ